MENVRIISQEELEAILAGLDETPQQTASTEEGMKYYIFITKRRDGNTNTYFLKSDNDFTWERFLPHTKEKEEINGEMVYYEQFDRIIIIPDAEEFETL